MNDKSDLKESHVRSLLKACTWRIVATSATLIISYVVTGKTSVAITIAGVEGITKMVVYYFHERAWQTVPRGTIRTLVEKHDQKQPDTLHVRVRSEQKARGS